MNASTSALCPLQLVNRCDPDSLGFAVSSELAGGEVAVGQDRAIEALEFGLAIKQSGFNLFVLGAPGSGRRKLALRCIARRAATEPIPDDYCYVHNFDDARVPRALRLKAGQGARLRSAMQRVVDDVVPALRSAFDAQSYREQHDAIEKDIARRQEQAVEAVAERAATRGIAVMRTPMGWALAPVREGAVLPPEEVAKLEDAERQRLAADASVVEAELSEALRKVPSLQREQRDRIRQLDQGITRSVVRDLLGDARRAFEDSKAVTEHLDRVERDMIENAGQLLQPNETPETGLPALLLEGSAAAGSPWLRRYRVNLVIDHRDTVGAPVVLVDDPKTSELVGRVEHGVQHGVLVTDFNLIKPGALHRASGGYAVIDARRLLMQPVGWEQLKRSLRTGTIHTESVAEALDLSPGISQQPEPIPFTGKVVLIGEPWLYHTLASVDPDFDELFKVSAELEPDIERTNQNCRQYAELLAGIVRAENLLPLRADAAARLIDRASRMAEDSRRLSMHVTGVLDLMREASHWAEREGRTNIGAPDVERAIRLRDSRHDRVRERIAAAIGDGTLHVATSGQMVGQVNGLSVTQLGRVQFGVPTRITAQVRLGKGEVVDIQREVSLGGPIHSKGVLILSAFLGGRYSACRPLSLHASLVFEQTYGPVEGDSASLAELLALLSAISGLGASQSIAITGAVDQHGRVEAVGGINDKIEGFFDICAMRGLDGSQGVIIPAANVKHLMLRDDVVAAACDGRFSVYAVESVDDALQRLFAMPAGIRMADGSYPASSVNFRIDAGLERLSRAALAAARDAQTPALPEPRSIPKRDLPASNQGIGAPRAGSAEPPPS